MTIQGGGEMEKKIKPSDLRKQAGLLIAQGRMPSLEKVLAAVAETRAKYAGLILAACKAS